MKILFATDIDGTIISKQKTDDSIILSQTKWGESYITKSNFEKLQYLSTLVDILPITTRGIDSYKTLDFGINIPYAIVEGGAILLCNGEMDREWNIETTKTLKMNSSYQAIKMAKNILEQNGYVEKNQNIYTLDYIKRDITSDENEEFYKKLWAETISYNTLDINKSGSCGIFVNNFSIDKRYGLLCFLSRFKDYDLVICAGDSVQDYPMMVVPNVESIGYHNSPAKHQYTADNNANIHNFISFVIDTAIKIATNAKNDCYF